MSIRELRTALWHLRHGGPRQLHRWWARRRAGHGPLPPAQVVGAEAAWLGRGQRRRLSFAPTSPPVRRPVREDVSVAVILDDFSALAFGYEWTTHAVDPRSWQEDFAQRPVDLLFVESAWAGNGGLWRGKIAGADGPSDALRELLAWCRERGVPTVFWNKEDPPHYEDFLPAARLFDHVFTSDANRVPHYVADLGHRNVGVLPFAAQPAVHNPIRPPAGFHARDVAFAGMYFAHKYPERQAQMESLLGGAMDVSARLRHGLEIFSRQWGGKAEYQFPEPFAAHVVGGLSYAQMLTAYKAYKVFLNVNSVVDSPSMCARRIFEITASGTPVITGPSAAVPRFFTEEEVPTVQDRESAGQWVRALTRNPELNARMAHRAQRSVWREHSYTHRAEQVLAAAVPEAHRPLVSPSVSVLVSTIRPAQVEHVFETVAGQHGIEPQVVLLTHGFTLDRTELARLQKRHPLADVVVLQGSPEDSLGECLNACVAAADGEILTKMDDDDHYGAHYLSDQLNARRFSAADVVGKQAHYVHLENSGANLLRFGEREHRYTDFVMGPTLMASRDVFRTIPFEPLGIGEDTTFLRQCVEQGLLIYSSDRFNYAQIRRSQGHTWAVKDQDFLASADLIFYGSITDHVDL
ncbi:glycosyltransferase [Arthrobacter sp. NPDC090010]|uniref:glycosyltransferase family protein n=1 Tax=Arthrobacter sp. NPDC090010 TaxID=3363942 RepID=UPI0038166627